MGGHLSPPPKADEATSINPKKVIKPTSAASVANPNECADKNDKEQAKNHAISQGCPSTEASATASSSVQDLSSTTQIYKAPYEANFQVEA